MPHDHNVFTDARNMYMKIWQNALQQNDTISFNNHFSNYQNQKDLQITLLSKNIID